MAREIKVIYELPTIEKLRQKSVHELLLSELGFGDVSGWTPNVDIFETHDQFYIRAEIAGVKPEDITLTIRNRELVIRGNRIEKPQTERVYYHQMEISYGYFEKVIILPPQVRHRDIEATFKNGILQVVAWKQAEEKEIMIDSHDE